MPAIADSFGLGRARARRFWLVALLCAVCLGCGFHSDIGALARLRSQILARTGTDCAITVRTSEGKTTVTIRLDHSPPRDSIQVQSEIEALAKAEFPKTNYVVLQGRL